MTAYNIYWHDVSCKILIVQMLKNWQWQDAVDAVHKQIDMLRSVPNHRVSSIFDFSVAPEIPTGAAIPNLSELIAHRTSNHGLTIFVNSTQFFNMAMLSAEKIYNYEHIFRDYRFVQDLPSAFTLIESSEI